MRHKCSFLNNVGILQLYVAVSGVVGMNGAEALQGRGGDGDPGRSTDVLHPFQPTDAPLGYAAGKTQLISSNTKTARVLDEMEQILCKLHKHS